MKPTRQYLGVASLGLALMLPVARAQAPAAAPAPTNNTSDAWVLGRTYIDFSGGIQKFLHTAQASTGESPGLDFNMPLGDNLDWGIDYNYEHAANTTFKLDQNRIGTGFTVYDKMGWVAPFASIGSFYEWQHGLFDGSTYRYNTPFLDASGGFEFPVTQITSIRADVEHNYGARGPHQNNWNYGIGANAWLNSAAAGFVNVDWENGYNGSRSGVRYTAGVRFSFDSP
jgi:hypothetical protein